MSPSDAAVIPLTPPPSPPPLQVDIAATLGTLNVAAEVDGVTVKGDGEMRMSLSSGRLPNLNRQLQFVTYTNTLFHPSTSDTGLWRFLNSFHFPWGLLTSSLFHISVRLQSEGHRALFSIRIRHGVTPKLYNTGSNGGNQATDQHRTAQSS